MFQDKPCLMRGDEDGGPWGNGGSGVWWWGQNPPLFRFHSQAIETSDLPVN